MAEASTTSSASSAWATLLELPRRATGRSVAGAGRLLRGGRRARVAAAARRPGAAADQPPPARDRRRRVRRVRRDRCPSRTSPRSWSATILDEDDEPEPEPPAGPATTHARSRPGSGSTRSSRRPASALPSERDYETVSGLVMGRLGRVPGAGDDRHGRRGRRHRGDRDDLLGPDRDRSVSTRSSGTSRGVTLLRLRSDPAHGAGLA